MPGFDPSKFASRMDEYVDVPADQLPGQYTKELNALKGLSPEQIQSFGGTTAQMDEIIREVNTAKEKNLKQADLVDNLTKLGKGTYELAKKVSALIP